MSVEVAREESRHRVRTQGQSGRIRSNRGNIANLGLQQMERVFALVDREPATGYLVREHARASADVNEGTRSKPRQFARYGSTFGAESFEDDVDTKASEVSVHALDAHVVFGSASVVVGPQRGATIRQRC